MGLRWRTEDLGVAVEDVVLEQVRRPAGSRSGGSMSSILLKCGAQGCTNVTGFTFQTFVTTMLHAHLYGPTLFALTGEAQVTQRPRCVAG